MGMLEQLQALFNQPQQNNVQQLSHLLAPSRQASSSELTFFKTNPHVGGYAAPDNHVVLNPFSNLSQEEKNAVAKNEAMRIYMRQNNIQPHFKVTPEQLKSFEGTPYQGDRKALQQTIAARQYSGDPSGGTPTMAQSDFLKSLGAYGQ